MCLYLHFFQLSKDNLLDNDNGGNNYSPILSSNIQKSQSEHVISISGENEMERVINTENIIIDDSQITIISGIDLINCKCNLLFYLFLMILF